jgi:hypothetical protein
MDLLLKAESHVFLISVAKLITYVCTIRHLTVFMNSYQVPRSLHGDIRRCSSARHTYSLVHPVGM